MSPDTLKVLMRMEYEDELRLCVKLYNQHGGCKFNEGTRNICNYFTEYFDQNQDVIDSDISIINSMMEKYVFYGLYDYIYTEKEIEKAQNQIDAWQMIKNDVLALRGKHPESTSRENLLEEVKRINA